jgi:hypothetical protein
MVAGGGAFDAVTRRCLCQSTRAIARQGRRPSRGAKPRLLESLAILELQHDLGHALERRKREPHNAVRRVRSREPSV